MESRNYLDLSSLSNSRLKALISSAQYRLRMRKKAAAEFRALAQKGEKDVK